MVFSVFIFLLIHLNNSTTSNGDKESPNTMIHSVPVNGTSEKNLVMVGIHVIGINNAADINIAPYKYLFFACFFENTETVFEC